MSRAGYSDDIDDALQLGRWRAQVASTIRGKRGQAFLRELVEALDALPDKRLIAHELVEVREAPVVGLMARIKQLFGSRPPAPVLVCAIGSVGVRRGVDMSKLDPDDPDGIAGAFGITHQLVREIEYMNDEAEWEDDPEKRWQRMRAWAVSQLKEPAA